MCLGCGLCSILTNDKISIKIDERGYYVPTIEVPLSKEENIKIKRACPGIHMEGKKGQNNNVWGSVVDVLKGHSLSPAIRYHGASGGVVTSLAISLIAEGVVDYILQVGIKDGSVLENELKVSKTKEDVIRCAQSRYAPAITLGYLKKYLTENDGNFAFIGKPCDIAGLKNFFALYPEYKKKCIVTISIFCAGMPNYNATRDGYEGSGRIEEPISIQYRGDGCPGFFTAKWNDGYEYKVSYTDSWKRFLGRNLNFRCKVCPDGVGLLSDISVGDAWSTINGYPDFEESEGESLVVIRNSLGYRILEMARRKNYVTMDKLEIDKLKEIQTFQYQRRIVMGWRLLPLYILKPRLFSFKNMGIICSFSKCSMMNGLRELKGSLIRFLS